jgi:hypothetical protein
MHNALLEVSKSSAFRKWSHAGLLVGLLVERLMVGGGATTSLTGWSPETSEGVGKGGGDPRGAKEMESSETASLKSAFMSMVGAMSRGEPLFI